MARKDQSVMYLRDHGYSVVRLPRSDFHPLQTLIRAGKKDLQRSGELKDLLIMGTNPLPALSVNNTAPLSISGKESSTIKIDIGSSASCRLCHAVQVRRNALRHSEFGDLVDHAEPHGHTVANENARSAEASDLTVPRSRLFR